MSIEENDILNDTASKSEESNFERLSSEITEITELEELRTNDRQMFDVFMGFWNEQIYPRFAALAEGNEKRGAGKLLDLVVFSKDTIGLYNSAVVNLRKFTSSSRVRRSQRLTDLSGYLEEIISGVKTFGGDEINKFNQALRDIIAAKAGPEDPADSFPPAPLVPPARKMTFPAAPPVREGEAASGDNVIPAAGLTDDMVDLDRLKAPLIKKYKSAGDFLDDYEGGGKAAAASRTSEPPEIRVPGVKKVIEFEIGPGYSGVQAPASETGCFASITRAFKYLLCLWVFSIVCVLLYGLFFDKDYFAKLRERQRPDYEKKFEYTYADRIREIKERTRAYFDEVRRKSVTFNHPVGNLYIEMIALPEAAYWYNSYYDIPGRVRPIRNTLKAFSISRFEVTNAQFAEFVKGAKYVPAGKWGREGDAPGGQSDDPKWANHPAVNVTLSDAEAFCKWTGMRLPTEFEWQAAATGDGLDKPCVYGSNYNTEYQNLPDLVSIDPKNCRDFGNGRGTYPAGFLKKSKSWSGAYDMMGNVAEWCAPSSGKHNLPDISTLNRAISHGGSFFKGGRTDFKLRVLSNQGESNFYTGFRVGGPQPKGFK